jgi:hypothetical protein
MSSDSDAVRDRNSEQASSLEPHPHRLGHAGALHDRRRLLGVLVVAASYATEAAGVRARETVAVTDERYVSARELAVRMGVSIRTVNRLTAAGMPSETWGMARTRRYLPSEAIAWAQARRIVVKSWQDDEARSAADYR